MQGDKNINIKNKRATFDYELIETFVAGIVLTGTEIKSVRLGKAGLVDTYCVMHRNELWVKNMNISEYFYGSYNNHEARRDRKLLLNRKEINKGIGQACHCHRQRQKSLRQTGIHQGTRR